MCLGFRAHGCELGVWQRFLPEPGSAFDLGCPYIRSPPGDLLECIGCQMDVRHRISDKENQ